MSDPELPDEPEQPGPTSTPDEIASSSETTQEEEMAGEEEEGEEEEGEEDEPESPEPTKFTSDLILSVEDVVARGIEQHNATLYIRKFYQDSFGISTWLDHFDEVTTEVPAAFLPEGADAPPPRPVTFVTRVLDLQFDEALEIVKNHRFETWTTDSDQEEPNTQILDGLKARIDDLLQSEEFGGKAFMKLDTRSPKDAPFYLSSDPEVQQIVRGEFDSWVPEKWAEIALKEVEEAEGEGEKKPISSSFVEIMKRYPEEVYLRFQKSMQKCMKVTSGDWAVKLLTYSTRVYEDISRGSRFGEDHFSFRLIFREWLDEVVDHPEYEFRSFVQKGKLNAVSQYFCDNYFPDLIARKDVYLEEIVRFFEKIGPHIPQESYVLDVFVGSGVVGPLVIELNPFHTGAGGCLFSWVSDRELFMNGPLEFRIREVRMDEEEGERGWRKLVDQSLIPLWEQFLMRTYGKKPPSRSKKCILQ